MRYKDLARPEIRDMNVHEYAKKDGQRFFANLSLNINPFGTSKKVMEKLRKIEESKIYNYYSENNDLIESLADYIGCGTENVMLGDGCDGCLQMIANTFIERGDSVIIPTPTFHRYEFHTLAMGGVPKFVPMRNFDLRSEDVLRESKNNPKLVFLCDPNNPTGIPIKNDCKESIAKKFPGIVVIDEALADISGVSSVDLVKKYDNVIVTRSFSKTFGLASLRIGYIISNPHIINLIKKTSSPFKVNGMAQELSIGSLRDKNHMAKSKTYINENRNALQRQLRSMGFNCTDSVTTNFLMDISKTGKSSKEFVDMMKKESVLLTECSPFRTEGENYVRVSVGKRKVNDFFISVLEKLYGSGAKRS